MNKTIKTMSKKTLSAFLAIIMVFTAIPIYAFAGEGDLYTAKFQVGSETEKTFVYTEGETPPGDYKLSTLISLDDSEVPFTIPVLNPDEYSGWKVGETAVSNISEYVLTTTETVFIAVPVEPAPPSPPVPNPDPVTFTANFWLDTDTQYILNDDTSIFNVAPYTASVPEGSSFGIVVEPPVPPIPSDKVSFRGWSIYDPADPNYPSGFYTREKFWAFANTENPTPLEKDVNLYAVYSDKLLISFLDGSNVDKVVQTYEVDKLAVFNEPDPGIVLHDVMINAGADQRLVYWFYYNSNGSPERVYFNSTKAESDLVLHPYFSSAKLVLFDPQGGSWVNPQFPLAGSYATQPANPTRTGFDFAFWSTDKNANPGTSTSPDPESKAFSFATTLINTETTLYAIWRGQPVGFTVVYWVEQADGSWGTASAGTDNSRYEFYASAPVPASDTAFPFIAGQPVTDLSQAQLNRLSSTYEYYPNIAGAAAPSAKIVYVDTTAPGTSEYSVRVESAPLKGDGSSLVNVYFQRKVYTFKFDAHKTNRGTNGVNNTDTNYPDTGTVLANAYYSRGGIDYQRPNTSWASTLYSITGKYEQTIPLSLWPNGADVHPNNTTGTAYKNVGWFVSYYSRTLHANQSTVGVWMVEAANATGNNGTVTFAPEWSNSASQIDISRLYYVRATIADEKYVADNQISVPVMSTQNATTFASGEDFAGATYRPYISYDGNLYVLMYAERGMQTGYQKCQAQAFDYLTFISNVTDNAVQTRFHTGLRGDGTKVFADNNTNTGFPTTNSNATATSNPTSEKMQYTYFLYDRKVYTLSFNLGSAPSTMVIPNVLNIKFGENISGYAPSAQQLNNYPGHTFEGWYLSDPGDYLNPNQTAKLFDFAATPAPTMPYGGLELFAKWVPNDLTVEFYDGLPGSYIDDKDATTGSGGTVDDPGIYIPGQGYEGKGQFLYWAWLIQSEELGDIPIPFIFGDDDNPTKVTVDTELHAMWKTAGFKVTYNEGNGTLGTLPVDNKSYALNEYARVLDGAGIEPPSGEVFYGWTSTNQGESVLSYPYNLHKMTADTELVAWFASLSSSVSITYMPVIEDYKEPYSSVVTWHPQNTSGRTLVGATAFTHPQKELVGWATSLDLANASDAVDKALEGSHSGASGDSYEGYFKLSDKFATGTENVTLYAVWRAQTHEISFEAGSNGSLKDGPKTVPSILHDTPWAKAIAEEPEPVPATGYYFVGWTPSFPEKITQSQLFTANFALKVGVTFTSPNLSKPYDSTALVAGGTPTGGSPYTQTGTLKSGDKALVIFDKSKLVTNVNDNGSQQNQFSVTILRKEEDVTREYTINTTFGNLTITSKPVTVVVNNITKAYDNVSTNPAVDAVTYTVTGLNGTDTLGTATKAIAYHTETAGTKAGILSVTFSGNPNYSITSNTPGNLIITATGIDVDYTAKANSGFTKVYGSTDPTTVQSVLQGLVSAQLTAQGLPAGDITVIVKTSTYPSGREAGETVQGGPYAYDLGYTIAEGSAFNGTVTLAADLTITPRPATVSAVAASKPYAEADPTFTATTTGFLNGEAPTVAQYTVTRSNAGTEAVGSYPGVIVVANNTTAGYSNSNYTVTWSPATFTITDNPALNINVTVTANSASFVYNSNQREVAGYVITGLPATDPSEESPFTYEIGVSGATATNVSTTPNILEYVGIYYNGVNVTDKIRLTRNNGALTITQRPVILTVSGATKVVGTADDFSGVTAIFNDALATGAFASVSIGRTNGFTAEAVGTYANAITAYFFNNPNFAVTVVNGTLTITAAAVVPPVVPPVVPVVPAAPPAAPVIIPNPDVPLAPTTIADPETPLAQPITASWALVNLILAIVSLIYAIYLAIGYRKRREGEKSEVDAYGNKTEDTRGNRGVIWRTIAVIFGVVAPVVFFLTEDVTLPIALVDMWTLLMAVFVVIQIASAIVLRQSRKEDDDDAQSAAY